MNAIRAADPSILPPPDEHHKLLLFCQVIVFEADGRPRECAKGIFMMDPYLYMCVCDEHIEYRLPDLENDINRYDLEKAKATVVPTEKHIVTYANAVDIIDVSAILSDEESDVDGVKKRRKRKLPKQSYRDALLQQNFDSDDESDSTYICSSEDDIDDFDHDLDNEDVTDKI